jgi:predicted extracellular nuclease
VKDKVTRILIVAVGILLVSVPLFAHHGNAAFDTGTKVTVKGTVTEWYWANPHCFLKFDVMDDKGNVVHWVAETSNPADMVNRGWAKGSLKAGDEVAVTMQVVRGGNPIGRVQQIVLANGRILDTQLPPAPKPTDTVAKP